MAGRVGLFIIEKLSQSLSRVIAALGPRLTGCLINRDDFFIKIIIDVIDVSQLVVDNVVDRIGNREDPVTGLVKRISINNDRLRTKRINV